MTLGSGWGRFGHMEVLLVPFGPLWAYFLHWRVTLGAPWRHFGANVGIRGSLWDDSGVTLGSLWGHFGTTLGPLWVYGGPFSKNTHFPHRFQ